MNLNISPAADAQALARDHEDTADAVAREVEPTPSATASPTLAGQEPSPSERLYEAYRLWVLSGR